MVCAFVGGAVTTTLGLAATEGTGAFVGVFPHPDNNKTHKTGQKLRTHCNNLTPLVYWIVKYAKHYQPIQPKIRHSTVNQNGFIVHFSPKDRIDLEHNNNNEMTHGYYFRFSFHRTTSIADYLG